MVVELKVKGFQVTLLSWRAIFLITKLWPTQEWWASQTTLPARFRLSSYGSNQRQLLK